MDDAREPAAGADRPAVTGWPPLYFSIPLAVGIVLDRGEPSPKPLDAAMRVLGAGSIGAGLALGAAGAAAITRAGSAVRPSEPTTALVETGVFAATRNPIYVGMTAIALGVALVARSRLALALVPVALAQLDGRVVDPEERYLEERFGDRYRAYRARVPRWF